MNKQKEIRDRARKEIRELLERERCPVGEPNAFGFMPTSVKVTDWLIDKILSIVDKGALKEFLSKEKPPLLSIEEICQSLDASVVEHLETGKPYGPLSYRNVAQAQLDICIKHYEGE